MSSNKSLVQRLRTEGLREFAWQILWLAVVPILTGVGTAALARLQNLHWAEVALFGIFGAAGTLLLVNQFIRLRYEMNPRNKLIYVGPRVEALRAGGRIGQLAVGFDMKNVGLFPLDYEVVRINTIAEGQSNTRTWHSSTSGTVAPQEDSYFVDQGITIAPIATRREVECLLDYEMLYGRPGTLRYRQRRKVRIVAEIHPSRGVISVRGRGVESSS